MKHPDYSCNLFYAVESRVVNGCSRDAYKTEEKELGHFSVVNVEIHVLMILKQK